MTQQTFREFLAKGQPFGDIVDLHFVYDALRDPEFPDAESWQELEAYVRRRNPDAPPETLKAAQCLWQIYVEGR